MQQKKGLGLRPNERGAACTEAREATRAGRTGQGNDTVPEARAMHQWQVAGRTAAGTAMGADAWRSEGRERCEAPGCAVPAPARQHTWGSSRQQPENWVEFTSCQVF